MTATAEPYPLTWEQMPGKTKEFQKVNLALLKCGKLYGYRSCKGLKGDDLVKAFNRIKNRNARRGGRNSPKVPGSRRSAKLPDGE